MFPNPFLHQPPLPPPTLHLALPTSLLLQEMLLFKYKFLHGIYSTLANRFHTNNPTFQHHLPWAGCLPTSPLSSLPPFHSPFRDLFLPEDQFSRRSLFFPKDNFSATSGVARGCYKMRTDVDITANCNNTKGFRS